jgi:hypothetical protein
MLRQGVIDITGIVLLLNVHTIFIHRQFIHRHPEPAAENFIGIQVIKQLLLLVCLNGKLTIHWFPHRAVPAENEYRQTPVNSFL